MTSVMLVPPPPAPSVKGHYHLHDDFDLLLTSARGRSGPVGIIDDPAAADAIIVVGSPDPLHRDVLRSTLGLLYPRKAVLYDSSDSVAPFVRRTIPYRSRAQAHCDFIAPQAGA